MGTDDELVIRRRPGLPSMACKYRTRRLSDPAPPQTCSPCLNRHACSHCSSPAKLGLIVLGELALLGGQRLRLFRPLGHGRLWRRRKQHNKR